MKLKLTINKYNFHLHLTKNGQALYYEYYSPLGQDIFSSCIEYFKAMINY